jgi:hypothetical protein
VSGHLYQLWPDQFARLKSGAVRIDGPWDTFGQLVTGKPQDSGAYLIRGTGRKEIPPCNSKTTPSSSS